MPQLNLTHHFTSTSPYSPLAEKQQWEEQIPLSTAYHGSGPSYHTTTLVNDHLVVYGGQSSNDLRDNCYVIDIGNFCLLNSRSLAYTHTHTLTLTHSHIF